MPETKRGALSRAARQGFPRSSVTRASTGGYFIAPHGVTTSKAKHAYAECRGGHGTAGTCAGVAHKLQKRGGRK